MSRSLTVENDTHWRTKDIKRVIRAAIDEAGVDPSKPREVEVLFDNSAQTWIEYRRGVYTIYLPKRGSRKPHPNPLIALAGASIEATTPLLPLEDVYILAKNMVVQLLTTDKNDSEEDRKRIEALARRRNSPTPPAWGTDLYIAKYADPSKDVGYVTFVKKTEAKVAAAQRRVNEWQAEKDRADKNLKRALRDLKAAQRSLKDAKRRRGL